MYSERGLWVLVADAEDRDVWKLHLLRHDFAAATEACAGDAHRLELVAEVQVRLMMGRGED